MKSSKATGCAAGCVRCTSSGPLRSTTSSSLSIAAASLGQVYRGRLHTGEEVAVKVQRPHLPEIINFDLAVLRSIARFISRFPRLVRGVDWVGVIDEFAAVIFEEMDYIQEGHNA